MYIKMSELDLSDDKRTMMCALYCASDCEIVKDLYTSVFDTMEKIVEDWKDRGDTFIDSLDIIKRGAIQVASMTHLISTQWIVVNLFMLEYLLEHNVNWFASNMRVKIDANELLNLQLNSKRSPELCTVDRDMLFAELIRLCCTKDDSLQNVNKQIKNKERLIRKLNKSNSELRDKCARLESRKEVQVIKEVVKDEEELESYYAELQVMANKIAILQDKVNVYEATTSKEDYEVQELVYKDIITDVDLSAYVIYIIGECAVNSDYPFPYLEINKTSNLNKLLKADYVLVDIMHMSHAAYYRIKSFCKVNNIKWYHLNNRNREAVISDVKRLLRV